MRYFSKVILGFFVLSFCLQSLSATDSGEPVSVSFQSLKECFPELAQDSFKKEIKLDLLRDKIDNTFLTISSKLRYRRVSFLNAKKDKMRLTLRAIPVKNKKYDYEMMLEKSDEKGLWQSQEIPAGHRRNPSQKDINSYISNMDILVDEDSFLDTKLNQISMGYVRQERSVQDLRLEDPKGFRTLSCENQTERGVVCACQVQKPIK